MIVEGYAGVFYNRNLWGSTYVEPDGSLLRFCPTAFRFGSKTVAMVEHEVEVACVADGTLHLERDDHGLRFSIHPVCNLLREYMRSHGGEVGGSVGYQFKNTKVRKSYSDQGRPITWILSTFIDEITVVARPAFRATRVRLFERGRLHVGPLVFEH